MIGAGAAYTAGKNFGTLAYALLKAIYILVIDIIDFICAEGADLFLFAGVFILALAVEFIVFIHNKH